MRLFNNEKTWAPVDQEGMWAVIPAGAEVPQKRDEAVSLHVMMANRLVQELEDDPVELREANALLQGIQYLEMVPDLTWSNPRLPMILLRDLPTPPGSGLALWKGWIEEALKQKVPILTGPDAEEYVGELSLQMWTVSVLM